MSTEGVSARSSSAQETTPKPTDAELKNLYKEISKGGKPVLLSVVLGFCNDYIPRCEKGVLPLPLISVFDNGMLEATYVDLLVKYEEVFSHLAVTSEHARVLEEATKNQSLCKLWFQYRAGRITAALLKAAVHTDAGQPSQSVPGVHLGGGGGGGTRPPLIKSRPPFEIASLLSASHVHRASPPLFFINTHFAPLGSISK